MLSLLDCFKKLPSFFIKQKKLTLTQNRQRGQPVLVSKKESCKSRFRSSKTYYSIFLAQTNTPTTMDTCESPWHSWKSCFDPVERCEDGYCVVELGFIILIGIIVVATIFKFSAAFVVIPAFRQYSHAVNILLGVCRVFMLISLALIVAGIIFTFM